MAKNISIKGRKRKMSLKGNKLQGVLQPKKTTETKAADLKQKAKKVKVIYSIPPTAKKQFDRLALDLDLTKQDAFREALNDFFRKHGKPEIA